MTLPPNPDLRTTFHRVADSTVPLPVDDDLWQRGRAARRRGQAFAVAAVLVLVASVGGIASLVVTTDREARTASGEVVEGGAIPRRITDIPPDLDLTADLAIGRASVAFLSLTGDPVVVTATDGVPHRLALPGWNPARIALSLSPDGRTLAYQQSSDGGTQVALLDLDTGRNTPLLVHPGDELKVDGLSWSPRGGWLAWVASAMGDLPAFAGQVRTSGEESRRVAPPANVASVAIAEDGTSAIGRVSGGLFVSRAVDLERVSVETPGSAGAFSPDGSQLALGSSPDTSSYTLDMRTQEVVAHPFPDGTLGESVVRPLGWMDDRLQVLLAQEMDGDGGELVVTTPAVDDASTWRRRVGTVAPGIANSVSLAVDLLPDLDGTSSQQLTHDFGDPLAPDGRDISWMIGLGVAAAVAVLMGLRRLWRRRLG